MKKLLAFALVAGMLVGCGAKEDKVSKLGFGSVTAYNGTNQVVTTAAVVALDKDGKIVYAYIDVAQSKMQEDGTLFTDKSKKELKEDYDMKDSSEIGKEWYEQAKALEDWLVGKTVAEAKEAADIQDDNKSGNEDLKTSVTIKVTDYFAALEEAANNTFEANGAKKVGLGMLTAYNGTNQVNTTISVLGLDGDKITAIYNDVEQSTIENGALKTDKSKKELKEGYNMKSKSGIGKEWYEQQIALEEFSVGKTVAEAKEAATIVDKVPTAEDLKTSVTIKVGDYFAAMEEANTNAADVK